MYGLDFSFQKDAPWLTKALDALPFYSTKAPSSISVNAELAALRPGHARGVNQADDDGAVYLDDFEGTTSSINLGSQILNWNLASVPQNAGVNGGKDFPESRLIDDIRGGVNRARLNWYSLEFGVAGPDDNPYTRRVPITEIFENEQSFNTGLGNNSERLLDVFYDPTQRGPYNFETPTGTQFSAGMNPNGTLRDPQSRWAGITQAIQNNTDFQSANVEFIEFWMLSPFIENQGGGGEIVFNLGNVSEDLLRDSKRFYENGLNTTQDAENARSLRDSCDNVEEQLVATTNWGRVPRLVNRVRSFNREGGSRNEQDLGFDGFNDEGEREHYSEYVAALEEAAAAGNLNQAVLDTIKADVSNDNFTHHRDYANGTPVRTRYSKFNGTQGNSRDQNDQNTVGITNGFSSESNRGNPDDEDLDRNNSLNETEAYFEYRIPVEGDGFGGIAENEFITDVEPGPEFEGVQSNWYRFKIPLNQPTGTVGGISDFRAIRFMRMYMTGFMAPRTFRFARLELISNRWRRYTRELSTLFGIPTNPPLVADFDINTVNINENGKRIPFSYVLPPRIVRENSLGKFP